MAILIDTLKKGVKVHGRRRNKYQLCRVSTDDCSQRGLQNLHDWVQDLENTYVGASEQTEEAGGSVAYWFEFHNWLPVYHLSRPKREWAMRCGAEEVSDEDLERRCRWTKGIETP